MSSIRRKAPVRRMIRALLLICLCCCEVVVVAAAATFVVAASMSCLLLLLLCVLSVRLCVSITTVCVPVMCCGPAAGCAVSVFCGLLFSFLEPLLCIVSVFLLLDAAARAYQSCAYASSAAATAACQLCAGCCALVRYAFYCRPASGMEYRRLQTPFHSAQTQETML